MELIKQSSFQSIPRQARSLEERHAIGPIEVDCCGLQLQADTGVYTTSGDSELMAESVKISPQETFLEIGCGSGIVSIVLAKRALSGVGVDINDLAVANSKLNAERHNITNVIFYCSNVFDAVDGVHDVIVCNPPYTKHDASDNIDRMFWDPDDEMKRRFFKEVGTYLKENGRIYFGWANFADIDVNLPFQLAEENGYECKNIYKKPHPRNEFYFYVLEFQRK